MTNQPGTAQDSRLANAILKAIWEAMPGSTVYADVVRATDAVLAALAALSGPQAAAGEGDGAARFAADTPDDLYAAYDNDDGRSAPSAGVPADRARERALAGLHAYDCFGDETATGEMNHDECFQIVDAVLAALPAEVPTEDSAR